MNQISIVKSLPSCFGFSILLLSTSITHAVPEDFEAAISVEAEFVEFDRVSSSSVYRGDVVLTRGTIVMKADRVEVVQQENGTVEAVATGSPATYQQVRVEGEEPVKASAQRIEYNSQTEMLELSEGASLQRGQDTLTSRVIRYNMAEDKIVAGSGGEGQSRERVRITIQPPSNDQGSE